MLSKKKLNRGFTMIELLVVMGIVAILVLMAVPTYQGKIARDQVVEAGPLAELAKKQVAAVWLATQTLPANNAAAGCPLTTKLSVIW